MTSLCTHQPQHRGVRTGEGGKPGGTRGQRSQLPPSHLGLKPVVYSGCGDWVVVVTFIF